MYSNTNTPDDEQCGLILRSLGFCPSREELKGIGEKIGQGIQNFKNYLKANFIAEKCESQLEASLLPFQDEEGKIKTSDLAKQLSIMGDRLTKKQVGEFISTNF